MIPSHYTGRQALELFHKIKLWLTDKHFDLFEDEFNTESYKPDVRSAKAAMRLSKSFNKEELQQLYVMSVMNRPSAKIFDAERVLRENFVIFEAAYNSPHYHIVKQINFLLDNSNYRPFFDFNFCRLLVKDKVIAHETLVAIWNDRLTSSKKDQLKYVKYATMIARKCDLKTILTQEQLETILSIYKEKKHELKKFKKSSRTIKPESSRRQNWQKGL